MATTMVESWAVDLATIGPIYPWVGSEGLLCGAGHGVLDRLAHLAGCASRAAPTEASCAA